MDANDYTVAVSDADWAKLASGAGVSAAEMRQKYEAALAAQPAGLPSVSATSADGDGPGDCVTKTFDVSLFDVLGIAGTVTFCGSSSSDWSATLDLELMVTGVSVWHTTYTLSPTNASVCFSPDLAVVKARFCVGIVGSNHCFNINGEGCYWKWSWHCGDFDETLFCFG